MYVHGACVHPLILHPATAGCWPCGELRPPGQGHARLTHSSSDLQPAPPPPLQTGSGKTYTILGPGKLEGAGVLAGGPDRGLAPRMFERLFAALEEERVRQDAAGRIFRHYLSCSLVEVSWLGRPACSLLAGSAPASTWGEAAVGAPLGCAHASSGRAGALPDVGAAERCPSREQAEAEPACSVGQYKTCPGYPCCSALRCAVLCCADL